MTEIEYLLKKIDEDKKREALRLYELGVLNGNIIFSNKMIDFISGYDEKVKSLGLDWDLSEHLRFIAQNISNAIKNLKNKYEGSKNSDEEKIINDFTNNLKENSKPLDGEINDMVNEHFFDLT